MPNGNKSSVTTGIEKVLEFLKWNIDPSTPQPTTIKQVLEDARGYLDDFSPSSQATPLDYKLEMLFRFGEEAISKAGRLLSEGKEIQVLESHLYNNVGQVAYKLSLLAKRENNEEAQKNWLEKSYHLFEIALQKTKYLGGDYPAGCCLCMANAARDRVNLALVSGESRRTQEKWALLWFNRIKQYINLNTDIPSSVAGLVYESAADSSKLMYNLTLKRDYAEMAISFYESTYGYLQLTSPDSTGHLRRLEGKIRTLRRWLSYFREN